MWRAAKSRRSYCRSRLRDDEPQRPVKAVERAQVPVLRVPGAAREVVGEAGDYAVLDARLEQGPDGLRGADGGIGCRSRCHVLSGWQGGLAVMITSGAVMNWAVWGVFATVGSYFFLMIAGGRRKP